MFTITDNDCNAQYSMKVNGLTRNEKINQTNHKQVEFQIISGFIYVVSIAPHMSGHFISQVLTPSC